MQKRAKGYLLLILIFYLLLASLPLRYQGLYEPDNYYYYSILQQVHGFSLPAISAYDHLPPAESHGLYYLAIIPHLLTGLSYLTIMRYIAIPFGLADILLAFILALLVFKNEKVALISAFLVAGLPAILARTLVLEYRGDVFVNVFALLMLIFMLKAYDEKKLSWKLGFFGISTISTVGAYYVWSGGLFVIGTYAITLLILLIYSSIGFGKKVLILAPIILCIMLLLLINPSNLRYNLYSMVEANPSILEAQSPTALSIIGYYTLFIFITPATGLVLSPNTSLVILATIILLAGIYITFRKRPTALEAVFWSYFIICITLNSFLIRLVSIAGIPVAIGMALAFERISRSKLTGPIILIFILTVIGITGFLYAVATEPVNELTDPGYINALMWIRNNTPSNATILTLWTDGSEVEGISNRYSYIDSVAALEDPQNTTFWFMTNVSQPFSSFKPLPSYILERKFWVNESWGFCEFGSYNIIHPLSLNCTAYYPQFLNRTDPNWLKIWNGVYPNTTLVYENNDTRIFKVD